MKGERKKMIKDHQAYANIAQTMKKVRQRFGKKHQHKVNNGLYKSLVIQKGKRKITTNSINTE